MLSDSFDKRLSNTINNVLIDKDGFDFILWLLDELNAFDVGSDFDNVYKTYANNAVRTKGVKLLELILKSNFDKYTEIMKRRKEVLCQVQMKN